MIARLISVNFKPENKYGMLLQKPIKESELPILQNSPFKDAFDVIELLSFPLSSTPLYLLKIKYYGDVLSTDLLSLRMTRLFY